MSVFVCREFPGHGLSRENTAKEHIDSLLANLYGGRDAVIFSETIVSSRTDIDRFIVTPKHEIDCRTLTEDATS